MQKKYLDGKTYFPLTVQKEILAMRKDIENNVQHAGQKFELVKQAYDEIKEAHGESKSKYTSSCSGCILNINQLIVNWFKLYDQQAPNEKRISVAPSFKPLTPIATAKDVDPATAPEVKAPSYKELLEKFNDVATAKEKKAILNGRKAPKKDELIEYFDGK